MWSVEGLYYPFSDLFGSISRYDYLKVSSCSAAVVGENVANLMWTNLQKTHKIALTKS